MEYVFGQYSWAQLSGKGRLTGLKNDWYPQLRPLKMRELLARTLAARAAQPQVGAALY